MFDPQANVAHRQDSSGGLISASAYDAYGVETATFVKDQFGWNARWGYRFDREIGLYYCQARYYSPVHGGWLTRDPIGYEGGINLYGYCDGGPVGYVDPGGSCRIEIWYNSVGGTAGYHAFIVATDEKTGKQYYFRGGVKYSWWDGMLINYRSGEYKPGSKDWLPAGDGNRGNKRLVVDDDKDCRYYIDLFNRRGREIDSANCDYAIGPANFYPGGGNSNSLARELLEAAGLPVPQRHPVWVPWWDSQLKGGKGR